MVATLRGRIGWGMDRDDEGHREYKLDWLIETNDTNDDPWTVLFCPGLPSVGATWAFGNGNDPWAYCRPNAQITPFVDSQEPGNWWKLTQTFSTRPLKRCQDNQIENPLAEPPKISGTFSKFTEEARTDRLGKDIKGPSHEYIRGSAIERDYNRPTVNIALNTATLPLSAIASMVDTVNDGGLWGLDPRMVKLSEVSWEQKWYGTCTYYFTVSMGFEINWETWDRIIPAKGTMVLRGHSPTSLFKNAPLNPLDPDPVTGLAMHLNPKNFESYKTVNGEVAEIGLTEYGLPITNEAEQFQQPVEFYGESNFLLLGIPSVLAT